MNNNKKIIINLLPLLLATILTITVLEATTTATTVMAQQTNNTTPMRRRSRLTNNNTGAGSGNNNNNNNKDRLPNCPTDSTFLPTVIRALRYYTRMLEGHANNAEAELYEGIVNPFGSYLTETAKKADNAAQELREKSQNGIYLVEEERYRSIVQEALAFYVSDLSTKEEIIREQLGDDHRLFYLYETEIGKAETMKETIDEKV
jgi:hypothetical protein